MLFGKTPVSALEEYCAKKGFEKPSYEIAESSEEGQKVFICVVEAVEEMAECQGRSKKEAKHGAATNLLKKLKYTHPDIQEIPQAQHEIPPVNDAVADLRDLCLQFDHPFPTFEMVQQDGPPEAPEFVVECRVATIKRYAKASTKKTAKQLAAKKVVDIIRSIPSDNDEREVATLAQATEDQEAKDRKKIRTYREYVESGEKNPPGTLLCDRHNFFKNFEKDVKKNAYSVLFGNYVSQKEQAIDLLKSLKIDFKTSNLPMRTSTYLFIELKCDLDVVFAGEPSAVYQEIIDYFKDMLD